MQLALRDVHPDVRRPGASEGPGLGGVPDDRRSVPGARPGPPPRHRRAAPEPRPPPDDRPPEGARRDGALQFERDHAPASTRPRAHRRRPRRAAGVARRHDPRDLRAGPRRRRLRQGRRQPRAVRRYEAASRHVAPDGVPVVHRAARQHRGNPGPGPARPARGGRGNPPPAPGLQRARARHRRAVALRPTPGARNGGPAGHGDGGRRRRGSLSTPPAPRRRKSA